MSLAHFTVFDVDGDTYEYDIHNTPRIWWLQESVDSPASNNLRQNLGLVIQSISSFRFATTAQTMDPITTFVLS